MDNTNFIVLVDRSHPLLTLKLSENLPSILHNYLVGFEGPIAADAVPTIRRFDDFDADIILTSSLGSMLETLKVSIATLRT